MRSVTVVAANVDPLPAVVSRNLSPAGIVGIVIERAAKAEREQTIMAEVIVETIVEVVVRTPRQVAAAGVQALNASGRDRSLNTPRRHRRGGHWTAMHRG
jgi:hypothetical protein